MPLPLFPLPPANPYRPPSPHRVIAVEQVGTLQLSGRLLQPPVTAHIDVLGVVAEPAQVAFQLVADESLGGQGVARGEVERGEEGGHLSLSMHPDNQGGTSAMLPHAMHRCAMRHIPHLASAWQADHDEDLLDASDAGPLDEGAAV